MLSKLKRTLLVCLAGSIGIIGVATVLSVSNGVQNYIHGMQDDMLSGNPVTISAEALDLSSMMSMANTSTKADALKNSIEDGYVNIEKMVEYLVGRGSGLSSFRITNDITQNYVDFVKAMPQEYYNAISTDYGLNLSNNIYTNYNFGETSQNISLSAAVQIYTSMLQKTDYADFANYISMLTSSFMQAPNNSDFILSQYDILSNPETSKIATEANEIMIVVSNDTTLTDLTLAQFGYLNQDEFFNAVYKAVDDPKYSEELNKTKISYDELLGKTFVWQPNNNIFNEIKYGPNVPEQVKKASPFSYNAYSKEEWEGGIELKVSAILKPKANISYGCLSSGFYYTAALADQIIENSIKSDIVKYLVENNISSFKSGEIMGNSVGIIYDYNYTLDNEFYEEKGYLGSVSSFDMLGSMLGQGATDKIYTLSIRELGGINLPESIAIYPTNFDLKDSVTKYLSRWNSNDEIVVGNVTLTAVDRQEIVYTDNLAIIIDLINNLISIVTTALVAFTALSLVVSTVMIAIITYVSVMERIKEIGVIRSLGGRKRDVSYLFIAETFILGGAAGIIGIGVTYLISGILNLIIGNMFGIYGIASLPVTTALIMIAISIGLTLISGLIPARLAAKKDPVVALRTE